MRNRGVTLLVLFFCYYPFFLAAQPNVAEKAFAINAIASKYHVSPRPLNDSFSLQVFRSVMSRIDPYSIYFNEEEYLYLQNAALGIDEQVLKKSTAFLQALQHKYKGARKRFVQQAQSILASPLSFSTREYFTTFTPVDEGKIPSQPQPHRTKAYLKWRVLAELSTMKASDSSKLTAAFVKQHVMEAQKKVQSFFEIRQEKFVADSVGFKKWLDEAYLNGIAQAYDPHTEYLSSEQFGEFESSLSSESLAFGFGLEPNNEGNLTIRSVLPGSAAWQSNNIYEGDVIIAIRPAGGAAISVANATPEELNTLFEKYADQAVEFTIRAKDGTTRIVKLKKQAIRNEENVVRGWILHGQPKIGYISLPSFYTQTDDGIGTSSAEDVAREIVKLKQEKIEGLILDLRFNGGGSVEEAAAMLGIFIDIGPLGVSKLYNGTREVIKDLNRGTIYDGPLVVMVNGASASASEMLAATLQDYRKAVVVGSSTFGKATMQIVVPLRVGFDLEKYDPSKQKADTSNDYLKITIGKIYRVSGKTAQNSGVTPDVYLPDYFEATGLTERSLPTALPADTIKVNLPVRMMPEKYSASLFKSFEQTSVLTDTEFVQLQQELKRQIAANSMYRVPLLLDEFNDWNVEEDEDGMPLASSSSHQSTIPYKVINTRLDAAYNDMDSYQKENDEYIIEDLSYDPWLKQVYLLFKKILIQ